MSRENIRLAVSQPETIKRESQIKWYGLGGTGVPFLAKGESLSISDRSQELEVENKLGEVDQQIFKDRPISNIVFHRQNGRDWENGSWIVEIEGGDPRLDLLDKPGQATVMFFEVEQELGEVAGVDKMVQIGVNVGGDEVVFKRILLPKEFTDKVGQVEMIYQFEGMKMPSVFVDVWEKMEVGEFNAEWSKKVYDQLSENVRDMNNKIEYQMIDGEKWVEWNGEKMWAGVLSDRNDVDRFLTEEQALADLKPGEYLVSYYSHGGEGGAVSAATMNERESDQPKVIGDVQMMGEDGKIYQAAVEGSEGEIGGLIEKLVGEMKSENGLIDRDWFVKSSVFEADNYSATREVLSMSAEGKLWSGEAYSSDSVSLTLIGSQVVRLDGKVEQVWPIENSVFWSGEFTESFQPARTDLVGTAGTETWSVSVVVFDAGTDDSDWIYTDNDGDFGGDSGDGDDPAGPVNFDGGPAREVTTIEVFPVKEEAGFTEMSFMVGSLSGQAVSTELDKRLVADLQVSSKKEVVGKFEEREDLPVRGKVEKQGVKVESLSKFTQPTGSDLVGVGTGTKGTVPTERGTVPLKLSKTVPLEEEVPEWKLPEVEMEGIEEQAVPWWGVAQLIEENTVLSMTVPALMTVEETFTPFSWQFGGVAVAVLKVILNTSLEQPRKIIHLNKVDRVGQLASRELVFA